MTTAAVYHRLPPLPLVAPPHPPARPSLCEPRRQFQFSHPLLLSLPNNPLYRNQKRNFHTPACLSSSSSPPPPPYSSPRTQLKPSTRLYVSGLSFRTTEDTLRNAFKIFGELLEVKLVMDKIANRPRGFAFLRYATEEESKKAIEGMHGKFLDGRVIFVEVAKSRTELSPDFKQKAG